MSAEDECDLVMPFVNVQSVGGDYDDGAFAAGFEVGQLDARLAYEHPPTLSVPVRAGNLEQIDLVAMRRGYTIVIDEPEPGYWTSITLEKTNDE